jgi:hypothetical protein
MKSKTKRWARPIEFEQRQPPGYPSEQLARILKRTPRTVRDWQLGNRPIPAWAPELLRLRHVEGQQTARQLEIMKLSAQRQKIAPTDPPRSNFLRSIELRPLTRSRIFGRRHSEKIA